MAAGMLLLLAALRGGSGPAAAAQPGEGAGAGEVEGGLHWHAPAGCPSQAIVQARLAHALGPDVEVPAVQATVSVDAEGRFHADVVLRGPWGETSRQLDSPTCDTLAEAVVLLAAVSTATSERTLEPESESVAVPEPEPEPKPVAVPIEAVPEDRGDALEERPDPGPPLADPEPGTLSDVGPPAPEAAEPSSPAWRGVARVEARVGAGALPRVDLGAAATLGLVHRWARIELTAAGWLPRERTVAPDARVRVSLWTGALRGCAALRPTSWVALLPCAGLELGSLRGEGRGDALEERRTIGQPWVAIELTPAASFRLHRRVGLWLGASAIVPVRRLGFVLGGVPGDAHRVAPIVGRGALGLELHFW